MSRRFWLLGALLAVSGCVQNLGESPWVKGKVPDTGEIFVGSLYRNLWSGDGYLELRSDRGTTCFGRFVYVNQPPGGSGTLDCGPQARTELCRSCRVKSAEPFSFVLSDAANGQRGAGSGMIDARLFTFTLHDYRTPSFWDGVPECLRSRRECP
jgi:hypothetical protein